MKHIECDPTSLRPNPWNTNEVSPENGEKLRASIRKHGMFKPIVCRELDGGTLEILGGQHRCEVAIEMGLETVPVFNLGRLSDEQAKEIGLIDNARYGTDDAVGLAELIKELGGDEIGEILPFSDSELELMMAASDVDFSDLDDDFDEPDDDTATDEPEERAPKTHRVLRFKVPIGDDERISELIERTQKKYGYTEADQLTNAGDALVHLLLGEAA